MTCVVCGERATREAFVAEDWSLGAVPGPFHYVRCVRCGTVRLDPQPSDDELADAYPDRYVGHGALAHLLRRAGNLAGRGEARALVAVGNAEGRVLDAGCADGTFLLRLRAAGWHGPLHGAEPGAGPAATARARGIAVTQSAVEDVVTTEPYDLVVLRHVIEHVRNPRAVLARVTALVRPGGIVYVATPDERALSARVFGRYWHGYDPPRHLWVFRPAALRRLVAESGLELVDERWHLGAEVWAGSLGYVLSPRPGPRRRLTSVANPFVALPSLAAGLVEQAARRSTMYGLVARRAA